MNKDTKRTSPLRPILLWVALAAVAVAALGAGMALVADAVPLASPVASEASAAGALATADFRLPSLGGETLGPPDFAGKPVVVELWATWCGPCKMQAEHLETLAADYGDEVAFLAVNVGEDEARVRSHVAENPMPYPVLLDPGETLFARYGLGALPTVMVVDPAGEITFMRSAVVDARTLRAEIEAAAG